MMLRFRAGLTLTEVIVANFLALLVLIAAVIILSSSLRSIRHQDQLVAAEVCAREALDQERLQSVSELKPGVQEWQTVGSFRRRLEVVADDQLKEQVVVLKVVVQWQDTTGLHKLVRRVSYAGSPN